MINETAQILKESMEDIEEVNIFIKFFKDLKKKQFLYNLDGRNTINKSNEIMLN